MGWSEKYKRSIDCDNPKGFSQRAHCQGRKKKISEQLKPYKTVEQIAKKHRLEVSFIQNQLDMGEPIEHEHTKDHELAREIALQHLDEIPDYYTRLKKMEAQAKRHHKKFKDMKESLSEGKRDNKRSGDPGYSLRDWFKGGGWVQVAGKYKGKPCAKQPGQKTKPFCRDADDAAAMSKAEKVRRTAKKRKEDPNPERRGKAKMVSASYQPEGQQLDEFQLPGTGRVAAPLTTGGMTTQYTKQKFLGLDVPGTMKRIPMDMEYNPKTVQNFNKLNPTRNLVRDPGLGILQSVPKPSQAMNNTTPKALPKPQPQKPLTTIQQSNQRYADELRRAMEQGGMKPQGNVSRFTGMPINQSYEPEGQSIVEDGCPVCGYDPCQCLEGSIQEKKDACYHKVKSRYKVWPSAYASGALVKCRKVGADNWGTKTESTNALSYDWDTPIRERPDRYCPKCEKLELRHECKYGPKYWDMFSLPAEVITNKKDYKITMPYSGPDLVSSQPVLSFNQLKYNPNRPHPANEARDYEYSMARSELATIINAAKRLKKKMAKGEGSIEAWVQSKITKAADYIDTAADYVESGEMSEAKKCWPGYKKAGTQELFGKPYNRCVKEGYSNWREELAEDWQKVNRQDKTDGLSQKAVDAYRRENPGSKLQTAVTEKKPKGKRAKRRANFCRRMKGMKSKLTSAKTARDPDSRINKALRRWNCN